MSLRVRLLLGVLAAGLLLTSAPAQAATSGLEGIPHFDHVVVLWEENENAEVTFAGDSPFTYLTKTLRSKGVFTPNYYGTGHVSLDNYIAFGSGQQGNPLTYTDCLSVNLYLCVQSTQAFSQGRNLADQLEEKGVSWKQYSDGAPTSCFHGDYSPTYPGPDPYQGDSQTPPAKDYADRHVPWLYFDNIIGNQKRCDAHVRPFTDVKTDLASNALPAFSFITPDTCHDGHDATCSNGQPGGLKGANTWLATHGPALVSWLAKNNGLLVVTFDENGFTSTDGQPGCAQAQCPSLGAGGRVGAVFVSPRLPQGATVNTAYDHYGLLRMVEDSFGISEHLNLADRAAPMADVFAGIKPAAAVRPGKPVAPSKPTAPKPTGNSLPVTGAPVLLLLLGAACVGAAVTLRRRSRAQSRVG